MAILSKKQAIRAIQTHIKTQYPKSRLSKALYSKWKVGITNNTEVRYDENLTTYNGGQGRLTYYQDFELGSLQDAKDIESHFCAKGFIACENKGFPKKNSRFVYVFRVPDSYFEQ